MTTFFADLYANPYVRAAVVGALIAARIDYVAFQSWKDPAQALAYNWKIAAWRWFQGAVIGVVSVNYVG